MAPRRLEFADTKVISNSEYNTLPQSDKDNNIYLVKVSRNKKFFSFGKNAVKSQTNDNVKIPVDRQLNSVINLWLNFNKTDHFLQDSRCNKLTKNGLTKFDSASGSNSLFWTSSGLNTGCCISVLPVFAVSKVLRFDLSKNVSS